MRNMRQVDIVSSMSKDSPTLTAKMNLITNDNHIIHASNLAGYKRVLVANEMLPWVLASSDDISVNATKMLEFKSTSKVIRYHNCLICMANK